MQIFRTQSQIFGQINNKVAQGMLWVLYLIVYWSEPGPTYHGNSIIAYLVFCRIHARKSKHETE